MTTNFDLPDLNTNIAGQDYSGVKFICASSSDAYPPGETAANMKFIFEKLPKIRTTLLVVGVMSAILISACAPFVNTNNLEEFEITSAVFSISPEGTLEPEATPTVPEQGESGLTADEISEQEDEQFLIVEEVIIGLLFVAVLVGVAAQRLRVPYTVGLVIIGLVLTLRGQVDVQISPNLILALLVPPLIFEAAFHLNYNDLRSNLAPILIMAVPGVILTTLIAGGIVAWGAGLALPLALVFGALVSATDPVSVVALFRTMGVPKRLQVLLEGESLFNDGTAIVVFNLVIIAALQGFQSFNLADSIVEFVRVAGGGLIVGFILGWLVSQAISRIDDYLIETTLTSVLAFGSYLIGEHLLGVSGVLAVVAAGLVNGNIGPRGMSPTTRIVVFNFWEYAAFISNSFIFLLIGLRIDLNDLFNSWQFVVWAVIAVLIARAISIYGLSRVSRDIPSRWRHILYWGGLRGAISLALALSLPAGLDGSNQIQLMAFGVVLFTLLVQGFSMSPLVRRLGLVERSEMQEEYERRHARAVASRAAYEHLERRYRQGLLSDHVWKTLAPFMAEHSRHLADTVRDVFTSDPSVEAEEMDTARRESLRAQRSALNRLRRDGVISDDNYAQLVAEIDTALTESRISWPELLGGHTDDHLPIDRLMAVVIQEEDLEIAFSALTKLGFTLTHLQSSGGFLSKRNATLLVGLAHGHEAVVHKALNLSSRRRIRYLSTPIEGMPVTITTPLQVTVGGATIFTFEVERFETF
jgi:CPA1 family monovalent cation:H+ antiporter